MTEHSHRRHDWAAWEEHEADAAGVAAAAIGGRAGDEGLDPAQRPLVEAGEGVAEGFELAEADLIDAAENRSGWADPGKNAFSTEREIPPQTADWGEADHEQSSELLAAD